MIGTKAIIPLIGNRRVAWLVGVVLGRWLLPLTTDEVAELDGLTVWLLQLFALSQHMMLMVATSKVAFSCASNLDLKRSVASAVIVAASEQLPHPRATLDNF